MANAKRHRHRKPPRPGEAIPAPVQPAVPKDRLRPWLLAAAVGLWVVRPLYPSEGAAMSGDGLPVVMLWLVLLVVWLAGAAGRREFRLRFGWVDAGLLAGHCPPCRLRPLGRRPRQPPARRQRALGVGRTGHRLLPDPAVGRKSPRGPGGRHGDGSVGGGVGVLWAVSDLCRDGQGPATVSRQPGRGPAARGGLVSGGIAAAGDVPQPAGEHGAARDVRADQLAGRLSGPLARGHAWDRSLDAPTPVHHARFTLLAPHSATFFPLSISSLSLPLCLCVKRPPLSRSPPPHPSSGAGG